MSFYDRVRRLMLLGDGHSSHELEERSREAVEASRRVHTHARRAALDSIEHSNRIVETVEMTLKKMEKIDADR